MWKSTRSHINPSRDTQGQSQHIPPAWEGAGGQLWGQKGQGEGAGEMRKGLEEGRKGWRDEEGAAEMGKGMQDKEKDGGRRKGLQGGGG